MILRFTWIICLWCLCSMAEAQPVSIPNQEPPPEFNNIYSRKLEGDSLSTSFLIWIKQEVKPHFHAFHSETLYILEGKGIFTLDGHPFEVVPGDFLFIPAKKIHSLTVRSVKPMKVLSVQAPEFDGSDRILVK